MQPRPAEGMVCKPNSVPSSGGGHCSWIAIAGDLQRPTRNPFIRRGRKPHGHLPKRTCRRPSRHAGTAFAAHRRRADASVPYLVLHPVGFIMPAGVATAAVRSYRTFSPLPSRWVRPHAAAGRTGIRRSIFCDTFPRPKLSRISAFAPNGWALPTTVPCGVRTFLPPARRGPTARPFPFTVYR